MIVLKITNSSEVLASKVGKFLESLTPDGFDQVTVEDIVIRKLIENLAAEGLRGEVAAVSGLELNGQELVINKQMHVRSNRPF
jgi:hypothetical protein